MQEPGIRFFMIFMRKIYAAGSGMGVSVKIQISISVKNAPKILKDTMECISRVAKSRPQWEKHKIYDCYETECDASENDMISVFNELIAKYPNLDIYASYSQSIREDDSSAQWWSTTKIKTEHHPDGTAALAMDSSTYWF